MEAWLSDLTKRFFDIVVAMLGLLIFAPAMVIIAVLIKQLDGGEVLYRGKRTGRHGETFYILKFRTMVPDAERLGGTTTGKSDPRITRVGSFLRRFKLDELPQFLNVLKGDMSMVGPRPEVSEYTDRYSSEEQRILSVRPGITDWASLEFNDLQEVVGAEDPDENFRVNVLPTKNALRLKYVDNRSLVGDVVILSRTVAVVAAKPFRRAA